MSDFFSLYVSIQILLTLSFLLIRFFRRFDQRLDFGSQLKTAYSLIFISLVLPIFISFMPGENPFGPIAKVWSETAIEPLTGTNERALALGVPPTAITPPMTWRLSFSWSLLALTVLIGHLLGQFFILTMGFFRLRSLVRDSFLYKSFGNVKVWLNEEVDSPFSFANRNAHVILPMQIIEEPEKLKMAVAHEIQHHRQRDTRWIYLLESFKILFGINPLVRKMISSTEELQELACDESLLKRNVSAKSYGECLYSFAEQKILGGHHFAGAVGMATKAKLLKKRISFLAAKRQNSSVFSLAAVVLVCLFSMSSAAWVFRGVVTDRTLSLAEVRILASKTSEGQTIPIEVDKSVVKWLNRAIGSETTRRYLRESLARMKLMEPMIVEKLKQAKLPEELIAVPLIESGFRNNAISPADAAGIWQFMPGTARRCGLRVDKKIDERKDPDRLTDAAACYYKKLHAIFQDWHVALTAYYLGENRMMRAIADASHNNVMELARGNKLGTGGRDYLPKIMAAMILLKNPKLVN